MKKINDKEKRDLEIAEEAIRKAESIREELLAREVEGVEEEGMEQSGTSVVERMVENVHRVARMDREAAASRLQSRLRGMERRKRTFRRWLYAGSSVAAAIAILFTVTVMFPEKELAKKKVPVVKLAKIKVPTLIMTGEDDAIVALDTLEVKKEDDVYVVGEEEKIETTGKDKLTETPVRDVRIVIPAGFTYNVQLADGSTVMLNAGSELRFPEKFRDSIREVELIGEGYFKVEKSDVPFVVKAGEARIKVYGTEFNVFYSEKLAQSEAVLVQGSIGMTAGGTETMILPNQRICFSMKDSAVRVGKVDPADYIAWLGSSFKYNRARLDKIIFDISQWYGVEIEIAPGLEKETFSLEFDKSSTIDWVVRALGLIINKPVKTEGGVYYIE